MDKDVYEKGFIEGRRLENRKMIEIIKRSEYIHPKLRNKVIKELKQKSEVKNG
jgi:hypothetical protein